MKQQEFEKAGVRESDNSQANFHST